MNADQRRSGTINPYRFSAVRHSLKVRKAIQRAFIGVYLRLHFVITKFTCQEAYSAANSCGDSGTDVGTTGSLPVSVNRCSNSPISGLGSKCSTSSASRSTWSLAMPGNVDQEQFPQPVGSRHFGGSGESGRR